MKRLLLIAALSIGALSAFSGTASAQRSNVNNEPLCNNAASRQDPRCVGVTQPRMKSGMKSKRMKARPAMRKKHMAPRRMKSRSAMPAPGRSSAVTHRSAACRTAAGRRDPRCLH